MTIMTEDNILYENSYNNGTREYERLCNEKTDEFKTYISIAVAVLALQCSDFLNLSEWKCFLIPLIVIIISIIFGFMTTRTETFIRGARKRLVEYEKNGLVKNEWYLNEKKDLRNGNQRETEGKNKKKPKKEKKQFLTLYHMIILTYVVMSVLSVVIAVLRFIK